MVSGPTHRLLARGRPPSSCPWHSEACGGDLRPPLGSPTSGKPHGWEGAWRGLTGTGIKVAPGSCRGPGAGKEPVGTGADPGLRRRAPGNHRKAKVGSGARVDAPTRLTSRHPGRDPSPAASPISVFRHWPEAVSQIRLQSKNKKQFRSQSEPVTAGSAWILSPQLHTSPPGMPPTGPHHVPSSSPTSGSPCPLAAHLPVIWPGLWACGDHFRGFWKTAEGQRAFNPNPPPAQPAADTRPIRARAPLRVSYLLRLHTGHISSHTSSPHLSKAFSSACSGLAPPPPHDQTREELPLQTQPSARPTRPPMAPHRPH